MSLFDNEENYALNSPTDTGTMVSAPMPGIGLAPVAPGGAMDMGVGMSGMDSYKSPPVAPSMLDRKKELISGMGGGEKALAALGEFGAAMQGKESPLEKRLARQREEKLLQLHELKGHMDALKDAGAYLETLPTDERKAAALTLAPKFDQAGLGDLFKAVAKAPDTITAFDGYEQFLPEPMKLMMKRSPKEFLKYATSHEGYKQVEDAKTRYYLTSATRKAVPLITNPGHVGVSPELAAEWKKGGRASLFNAMLDSEGLDKRVQFSPQEREAIARDPETFFSGLGVMSPKSEQDVIRKRAEDKGQRSVVEVGVRDGTMRQKAYIEGGKIVEMIGEPYKHEGGTTINMPSSTGMGTNPATGKEGHFTIGKDGVVRWDAIEPVKKEVDPVKKAIADIIGGAKGKGGKLPAPAVKEKGAPAGIPTGSTLIGKTPDGKDVYQSPDGKKWVP